MGLPRGLVLLPQMWSAPSKHHRRNHHHHHHQFFLINMSMFRSPRLCFAAPTSTRSVTQDEAGRDIILCHHTVEYKLRHSQELNSLAETNTLHQHQHRSLHKHRHRHRQVHRHQYHFQLPTPAPSLLLSPPDVSGAVERWPKFCCHFDAHTRTLSSQEVSRMFCREGCYASPACSSV